MDHSIRVPSINREGIQRHSKRFRQRQKFHVGDAASAELDSCNQSPVHIPSGQLQPTRKIFLRPPLSLPDTPNPRPEDISGLEFMGWFPVRHLRRLTVKGQATTGV